MLITRTSSLPECFIYINFTGTYRNMKSYAFMVMALPLAVTACATAEQKFSEQGIEPYTVAQTKQLLVGNTACGVSARGNNNCVYYGSDGMISLKDSSTGQGNAGTYTFNEAGKLCVTWTQNTRWPKNCVTVYPVADGEYALIGENGSNVLAVSQVLKGNAKGL